MDWFKFCLLIGSFVAFCESSDQYFFVITPNVIRFNHAETVLVSIFGKQKNVEVSVWLQYRNKQFSHKSVTVLDEGTPENTTIKVTEADIFDTVIDEKPRIIELCSQQTTTICKDIILSYKTGYLILQTDKPIYTPRQEVKIRLLALDESLKKITGDNLSILIDIVSPSNHTLGRRSFATTISGFYQNTFTLPSDPEIGMWTVRAFYGGKYETTARSSFQIKEYVLPTFGVTVDASTSYILLSDSNDTKVEFTIKAKYVYGKPVEGTARISLNVKDEAGDSKSLTNLKRKELQNGVAEFSIKKGNLFKSDALKAEAFHDGSRLGVVATVFESATGKEESTLKNDIVLDTEPYIFKFTRSKRYFRPGIEYFFKIDVFTPNNVPATDVKLQVLKLDKSGRFIHEKNVETDGKGQALAILPTTYEDRLILKVIAEGSSPSQTFEVLPYNDRNQINVESIIKDDIMLMRVISNMQIMYNPGSSRSSYTGIMFVVVTRGKVVHAIFKESSNVASEQIKDTLQELITPTARLLVFYVDKKSDRVVADSIKIDLDAKCKGSGF